MKPLPGPTPVDPDLQASLLHSILANQRPAVTFAHPIIDLRTGHLAAQELLTRFLDHEGHMRTVGTLLEDITLDPAMLTQLDLVCLGATFEALARCPVPDHLLFLNLHPMTLASPLFWRKIQPWLWDIAIPPHQIVFEITEGFSFLGLDQLEVYARELRQLEVRIAVDDLGSGVASLTHMARLAPNFIKVDRSLVHKVQHRPYQAALLNALSVFARAMNVGYIAEGIETSPELQCVIDADVPWGQGYIFGEHEPLAG